MKKYFSLITNTLLITIISVLLFNCKGDDGDPGPVGNNGSVGDPGAMGTTGAEGTPGPNGVGFDEAVAAGHVIITFIGTRPDTNEAFNITQDFKYTSGNRGLNSAAPFDGGTYFLIYRFLGSPFDIPLPHFDMFLKVDDDGNALEQSIIINSFLATADHKLLDVSGFYRDFFSYTDYSYDPDTGALKFKFDFTVPGANNPTGANLTLSGEADLIVYKFI